MGTIERIEGGLTRQRIISELTRAPHAKLQTYIEKVPAKVPGGYLHGVAVTAVVQDEEFIAHLIAWSAERGELRDIKVALPVIAVMIGNPHPSNMRPEYVESALAHLAELEPKRFLQALNFAKDAAKYLNVTGASRTLGRLAARYLAEHEQRKDWERAAIAHRRFLKALYSRSYATGRIDPPAKVNALLFGPSKKVPVKPIPEGVGHMFAALRAFASMGTAAIADMLRKFPFPFLAARGALGTKVKEPDILEALIPRMSQTEVVTNAKWLERLGVRSTQTLRATMEDKLSQSSKRSKRGGTLKATRAADALEKTGDAVMAKKMRGLQERQIDAGQRIKGDWLVLGDKSPSMQYAVETSRYVAATLARYVEGRVSLIFFDGEPRFFDVTGKTLEEILEMTKTVKADGAGTSIGCGLAYAREMGIPFDGIAVVSDAQENSSPRFVDEYARHEEATSKRPTTYLYRFAPGMRASADIDLARSCSAAGIDLVEFDLRGGVDYTSLPNVVLTMRSNRWSLVDEIMSAPLKTLDAVMPRTVGMRVLPQAVQAAEVTQ
jgi:hypothetical protein